MLTTDHPLVTILIPCRNERAFIEACLRSVQAQDYPPERLEILVAEGRSVDGTDRILATLAAEDRRIRVVDNPHRLQAPGLNALLRIARGQFIVRMDAHSTYPPDYVRLCVETLRATGAENVGGASRSVGQTLFQKAVCAAFTSWLGIGGAASRRPELEGFVDSVFLGAFPRRVFESVGLFDPHAVTNEDAELNQRLLAAGGRIYQSRKIVTSYHPRGSPWALARQYFRYGMGRARTLAKHGRFPNPRPALPFLMVVSLSLILALPWPWALRFATVGFYLFVVAAESLRVGWSQGILCAPLVAAVFLVLHLSHGTGFACGLVRYSVQRDWGPPERLAPLPSGSDPWAGGA